MVGFTWFGEKGQELLKTGKIYEKIYIDDTERFKLSTLSLKYNERLVGVKSGSGGRRHCYHYAFQWIICKEE